MDKAEWLFQFQSVHFSYINVFKFYPCALAQVDFFVTLLIKPYKRDEKWSNLVKYKYQ